MGTEEIAAAHPASPVAATSLSTFALAPGQRSRAIPSAFPSAPSPAQSPNAGRPCCGRCPAAAWRTQTRQVGPLGAPSAASSVGTMTRRGRTRHARRWLLLAQLSGWSARRSLGSDDPDFNSPLTSARANLGHATPRRLADVECHPNIRRRCAATAACIVELLVAVVANSGRRTLGHPLSLRSVYDRSNIGPPETPERRSRHDGAARARRAAKKLC